MLAIKAWVLRKKIVATYSIKTRRKRKDKGEEERAEKAAWAIAISLARHGMKPKPFFFKQIPIVREKFQKRVYGTNITIHGKALLIDPQAGSNCYALTIDGLDLDNEFKKETLKNRYRDWETDRKSVV